MTPLKNWNNGKYKIKFPSQEDKYLQDCVPVRISGNITINQNSVLRNINNQMWKQDKYIFINSMIQKV